MGVVKSAGLINHASLSSVAEEVKVKGGWNVVRGSRNMVLKSPTCVAPPKLRLQNLHLFPQV